jgi:hypothetical protein
MAKVKKDESGVLKTPMTTKQTLIYEMLALAKIGGTTQEQIAHFYYKSKYSNDSVARKTLNNEIANETYNINLTLLKESILQALKMHIAESQKILLQVEKM